MFHLVVAYGRLKEIYFVCLVKFNSTQGKSLLSSSVALLLMSEVSTAS
jgi:hypothetical protein